MLAKNINFYSKCVLKFIKLLVRLLFLNSYFFCFKMLKITIIEENLFKKKEEHLFKSNKKNYLKKKFF
jgi:hypothetical protein